MRLTLFMTQDMSLAGWEQVGMFEREVALYRRLLAYGVEVGFVTYGGPDEARFAERLPGAKILYNRFRLPPAWRRRLIPLLHGLWLSRADVVKTNQVSGGSTAVRAARLWRKPLIARCGYLASDMNAVMEGPDAPMTRNAREVERKLFSRADHVVVTTETMAEQLAKEIEGVAAKTTVIPNYVDTDLFRPLEPREPTFDVLFIGRLARQKNLEALLTALEPLKVTATIIGDGPLHGLVESAVSSWGGRLKWVKRVPHEKLPEIMAQSRILAQPSLWEGHPKTIVEAMAAGMAIVGGDSPGVRQVIDHGVTGLLSGVETENIREEVSRLLQQDALQRELGRNARNKAIESFSLDSIVEREFALLRRIAMGASSEGKQV